MSDVYTQDELKGMSRVQLRRAALTVLNIDNKEASNSKSGDLIDRILEAQEGGGSSNGKSKSTKASKASSSKGKSTRSTKSRASKAKDEDPPAEVSGDLGELLARVDAVGKALDEGQEGAKDLLEEINGGIADLQRQSFITFGLVSDIYKAHYEPDELEERCTELDQEWEQQGNGESGD